MEWQVNPEEYRYVLGDFVRSGIYMMYTKYPLDGEPSVLNIGGNDITTYVNGKAILFPYITGRQYQVYKEYHSVVSRNESNEYCIFGEVEAGDIDYDIEDFRNWNFFCEAFGINPNNNSIFQDETDWCYAFIFDYQVRFIDILEGGLTSYANIQKNHIFELYKNYQKQQPFYPLNMSLEWFYLLTGQRLGVDTVLRSIVPTNQIHQDVLMTNYVIDSFGAMSEETIIKSFNSIRDKYSNGNKTRMDEWYIHTASLMDRILAIKDAEHIAKKVRKVRSYCNNQGFVLSDIAENQVPYLTNVHNRYNEKAEYIYNILFSNSYIDEQTKLSDFKYYLTGELEEGIQGKIYWRKSTIELVEFIVYISDDNGEWDTVSKIFIDKNGNHPKSSVLKSTKNRSVNKYYDTFKQLLK